MKYILALHSDWFYLLGIAYLLIIVAIILLIRKVNKAYSKNQLAYDKIRKYADEIKNSDLIDASNQLNESNSLFKLLFLVRSYLTIILFCISYILLALTGVFYF